MDNENEDVIHLSGPEGENSGAAISNVTPPPNLSHTLPASLRPLNHFLKLGQDYCYYYAAEKGLALDKSAEGRAFIEIIIKWVEDQNLQHREEAIVDTLVAEAYIEKYIIDLMVKADHLERTRTYNKNTVKLLYTIGFLCETLQCFNDEMNHDFMKRMKYSKWRAAYIHKCLKNGETPQSSESQGQNKPDAGLDMMIPSIPNLGEFSGSISGYVNGNIGNKSSNNHDVLELPQATSDFDDHVVKEFSDSAEGSHHKVTFEGIKLILEAQRFSTIAASCLNFKEIETAKDMIRKALGILEKLKPN